MEAITPLSFFRNFCIIAHIDHGKSTLADRLIENTQAVQSRKKVDQQLDDMDLERERGITIKSHAIQMPLEYQQNNYILNLIDTPGHVDFSYEVSRSIAACEGALLVVDASQGIEAQTLSNLFLAMESDLNIIPIVNKIDLPSANTELVKQEIVELIGCHEAEIIEASAKTGQGVEKIIDSIITQIAAPVGNAEQSLEALVFDSQYDAYRGVIVYYKVKNGIIRKGDRVRFFATDKEYIAEEVGTLRMGLTPKPFIQCGDVGYVVCSIKDAKEVKVGDTLTHAKNPCTEPIKGFKDVKPMVFAGIYPVVTEDYEELRECMHKLKLNDSALVYEPEASKALGFGFRTGFLGLLHMEIVQERLDREFNMAVINTVPNVSFIAHNKNKTQSIVTNPSDFPDPISLEYIEEPFIRGSIITKSEFIGPIMTLCMKRRAILINQNFLNSQRVEIIFELPMSEVIFDFYDKLKSLSKGYASFDYSFIDYRRSDLVKMDIKLNGENVDALSSLVHRSNAFSFGKKICEKLKELLPRQQFIIAVQAALGAKIIARETVRAMRKDVTAKCYGGDITRKRKLLEKQKKGKKKMRQIGSIEVPQSAFMAILKIDN